MFLGRRKKPSESNTSTSGSSQETDFSTSGEGTPKTYKSNASYNTSQTSGYDHSNRGPHGMQHGSVLSGAIASDSGSITYGAHASDSGSITYGAHASWNQCPSPGAGIAIPSSNSYNYSYGSHQGSAPSHNYNSMPTLQGSSTNTFGYGMAPPGTSPSGSWQTPSGTESTSSTKTDTNLAVKLLAKLLEDKDENEPQERHTNQKRKLSDEMSQQGYASGPSDHIHRGIVKPQMGLDPNRGRFPGMVPHFIPPPQFMQRFPPPNLMRQQNPRQQQWNQQKQKQQWQQGQKQKHQQQPKQQQQQKHQQQQKQPKPDYFVIKRFNESVGCTFTASSIPWPKLNQETKLREEKLLTDGRAVSSCLKCHICDENDFDDVKMYHQHLESDSHASMAQLYLSKLTSTYKLLATNVQIASRKAFIKEYMEMKEKDPSSVTISLKEKHEIQYRLHGTCPMCLVPEVKTHNLLREAQILHKFNQPICTICNNNRHKDRMAYESHLMSVYHLSNVWKKENNGKKSEFWSKLKVGYEKSFNAKTPMSAENKSAPTPAFRDVAELFMLREQYPNVISYENMLLGPYDPDPPSGVNYVVKHVDVQCKACKVNIESSITAVEDHCKSKLHFQAVQKLERKEDMEEQPENTQDQTSMDDEVEETMLGKHYLEDMLSSLIYAEEDNDDTEAVEMSSSEIDVKSNSSGKVAIKRQTVDSTCSARKRPRREDELQKNKDPQHDGKEGNMEESTIAVTKNLDTKSDNGNKRNKGIAKANLAAKKDELIEDEVEESEKAEVDSEEIGEAEEGEGYNSEDDHSYDEDYVEYDGEGDVENDAKGDVENDGEEDVENDGEGDVENEEIYEEEDVENDGEGDVENEEIYEDDGEGDVENEEMYEEDDGEGDVENDGEEDVENDGEGDVENDWERDEENEEMYEDNDIENEEMDKDIGEADAVAEQDDKEDMEEDKEKDGDEEEALDEDDTLDYDDDDDDAVEGEAE